MKKQVVILFVLTFSNVWLLCSQENPSGKEFLIGGSYNYYDSIFIKNVLSIHSILPQIPAAKDQFETTEDYNNRLSKFQSEIKDFNSKILKPSTIKAIQIYNKVRGRDLLGNGFAYNADTKELQIACGTYWCIPCTGNLIWGIGTNIVGYTSSSKKTIATYERNGVSSSNIKEYWYWINFEVDPQIAKEIYNYTNTGGECAYSISIQISPRLVYDKRYGLIPIFFVDSYSLDKDGKAVAKFNPKNLPSIKRTDEEVLRQLLKGVISLDTGKVSNY